LAELCQVGELGYFAFAMRSPATLWFLMAAIVVLNTIAQTFLKLGAGKGLINAALIGGVAAYGCSTLLYVFVLGKANLSFAYPVVIGATAVATCYAGSRVIGEQISGLQWLGVAVIITGIAIVATARGGV
jgi:small multidrug resistance pump